MLKIVFTLLFATTLFAFHSAEVNINNKDFELKLDFDVGQFNESVMPDSLFFGIGYMNVDASHSDFADPEELVNASFLMQRPIGSSSSFLLGMGVRYIFSKQGESDFSALALGLQGRYLLPLHLSIPIYMAADFYYSPEVLSFMDAKNYVAYRVFGDVEIIERGHIVCGYRNIDLNYDRVDMNYNASWYLGFRFQF